MDPYRLLRASIKALPAMKFALAVAGLGAVVAIVLGFKLNPQVAVFGALIVLGLMFVLVMFTGYAKQEGSGGLAGPAGVLVWFYTIAVMVATILFMSSYFIHQPIDFRTGSTPAKSGPGVLLVRFHRTYKFKGNFFTISPTPSLNFRFSTLERDDSLVNMVQIGKLTVNVETANHSDKICCDIWIFLGASPFEFPEGATTVSQVGSYPWDISRDSPTQVKMVVGRPGSNTQSYSYRVTYDFASGTCTVDPTMGCVIKASKNLPMTLPNGLYAQVLVWTGFTEANLEARPVTIELNRTFLPHVLPSLP